MLLAVDLGNTNVVLGLYEQEKLVQTFRVATVRSASFQDAESGGSASIESRSVQAELPTHTRFVSVSAGASDRRSPLSSRAEFSLSPSC